MKTKRNLSPYPKLRFNGVLDDWVVNGVQRVAKEAGVSPAVITNKVLGGYLISLGITPPQIQVPPLTSYPKPPYDPDPKHYE